MGLTNKKLRFKFKLKKFKKKNEVKDFNINEIKLFFKIREFNNKANKKKNKHENDNKKKLDFEFAGIDYEGQPLYIEKQLAQFRIKKWKFLNYAEYKLWSVIYNVWKDIEFDYIFTRYKYLFSDEDKVDTKYEDKFDQDTESALLHEIEYITTFTESTEEAEQTLIMMI